MKKSLFIMALGAIALTSCSQDEVLEVKQDAIAFSAFTENASRADTDVKTSLTDFKVWAYNDNDGAGGVETDKIYINGVSATQNGSVWTLPNGYYWPSGTTDFYCVASTVNSVVINANRTMTADYSVLSNHSDDLLYAVMADEEKPSPMAPLALNFRHALSMIKFKVASMGTYGLKATVESVKLVNVVQSGKYTLPEVDTSTQLKEPEELEEYETKNNDENASTVDTNSRGSWSLNTATGTYEWDITDLTADASKGTDVVSTVSSDTYFVMPQTITDGVVNDGVWTGAYFLIDCVVWKNDVKLHDGEVAIPATTDFAGGYKYIYTLNFGKGAGYQPGTDDPVLFPIEFNITVDKFQAGEAVEVSVQVP